MYLLGLLTLEGSGPCECSISPSASLEMAWGRVSWPLLPLMNWKLSAICSSKLGAEIYPSIGPQGDYHMGHQTRTRKPTQPLEGVGLGLLFNSMMLIGGIFHVDRGWAKGNFGWIIDAGCSLISTMELWGALAYGFLVLCKHYKCHILIPDDAMALTFLKAIYAQVQGPCAWCTFSRVN